MSKVLTVPAIRPATVNDCENLCVLATHVWLHTYAHNGIRDGITQFVQHHFTREHFEQRISSPDWQILVCQQGPFLLGFVSLNLNAQFEHSENGFEVDKFYVYPHAQGKGVGKMLHQAMIDLVGPRFWLSTWVYNEKAIGFYRHLGFKDVGIAWFDFEGQKHENRVMVYNHNTRRYPSVL